MKQRHIRPNDSLSDDDMVVIRGGELDAVLLRTDALRNFEVYGVYGISVFAVRDTTVDELAQVAPLVRFAFLTLVRVGDLRTSHLELDPTGRNPRHFDVTFEELDAGVARLLACGHRTLPNPYYEAET